MRKLIMSLMLLMSVLGLTGVGHAATPETVDGVTVIHLDEYNGYFAARETLAGLKPGKYRFVVTNKAEKMVGFWLQDNETHEMLDRFPLEPGETKETVVNITENGFRYRCPINPTPWYPVGVSK
ncbi:hypothetical protein [Thiohalobacter thiocyanaticus]|uniref:Uncharacterized protein n=1 Tax=Thiohalobacter thiocyanaticus TaxID=585455 RepID=A0A426QIJ4_9GAMM|nr:hypothetical protein [Thiohalobacter thiocyanaticus]RRQ21581.1 hypothetical protein D6C00_06255 [Thiohalobacter thiocyanaticus]